ncbi:MAG: hypothetical protein CMM26_07000 [Rhodospirillaceae bacterium]|nr:hypothetical protein [Rhodospirillaceae bacterium]
MTKVKRDRANAWIIVHDFDQAVAALAAANALDHPITLLSAPGAARAGGAAWWRELMTQATAAIPHLDAEWILDCADEPGMALAALREGVRAIALDAEYDTRARVEQIAKRLNATLVKVDRAGILDLAGANNPQRACELHLSKPPHGVAKPGALG